MELINKNLIRVNMHLHDKNEVIREVAKLLYQDGRSSNIEGLLHDIHKREEEFSTSVGLGVAIPHAHSQHVTKPSLVFIKLAQPIQWGEDNNVQAVFGIANPADNQANSHLKLLAILARKLMDDSFREKLLTVEDKEEALRCLSFLE